MCAYVYLYLHDYVSFSTYIYIFICIYGERERGIYNGGDAGDGTGAIYIKREIGILR